MQAYDDYLEFQHRLQQEKQRREMNERQRESRTVQPKRSSSAAREARPRHRGREKHIECSRQRTSPRPGREN
jgi:hypothetical protein